MDKQYKNINPITDEILGIFYIVVPMIILGGATLYFKDEILNELTTFSINLFEYSF